MMLKIWDAENFRRTLAGLCLIAAPLVLFLALLIHPGEVGTGVQTEAKYPGRVLATNLLVVLSSVLFVPALIGLLRPIRERGVLFAHVGVGLALIGVIGHAVWAGFQIILVGMIQSGVDQEQLSAMVEGGPPNTGFVVVFLMFMIGFFLGLIFLAYAQPQPVFTAGCHAMGAPDQVMGERSIVRFGRIPPRLFLKTRW